MTRVLMAVLSAAELMGQQRYEQDVFAAMTSVAPADLHLEQVAVRSLRSGLPGSTRLPLGQSVSTRRLAQLAGRWVYRLADVVHRCDLRLPAAQCPEVLTVHDLAFQRFDDEAAVCTDALIRARHARIVLTPSEFVAEELRDALPGAEVRVAPNGVPLDAVNPDPLTAADRRALGLSDAPYVLHSGGATRRKNLAGLAAAWSRLMSEQPDLQLVMTGPTDPRRTDLFRDVQSAALTGRLQRDLQLRLLRSATVVVVPSTYEGFGLPALEAMAAGVPVVATAGSALTEVVGGAGLLVDDEPDALAGALHRVSTDALLARTLAEAGPPRAAVFTWEASARIHLRAYSDAAQA